MKLLKMLPALMVSLSVACQRQQATLEYAMQGKVLALDFVQHINGHDALMLKTTDGKVALLNPNERFQGLQIGDYLYLTVRHRPQDGEPYAVHTLIFAKSPMEIP